MTGPPQERSDDLPMSHERWQAVKRVFEGALERAPAERVAYVEAACRRDAALRAEVESLLAAHTDADSFLATPAAMLGGTPSAAEPSVLGEGHRIGRYRVLGLLGTGGMGQVYLAEDPRLGRKVALKLLPRALSADPDRLRRFEQEARAASALSHPNVCVVYEIGEADDGRHYIAMEHVPGASLRELLKRHRTAGTRVPLEEALDVVQQAAAGLQAAHDAGVVHRDVKPENVMVRPDGLVKVLDFGLAKLAERETATAEDGRAGRSVHTEPGMVLGTVQYMSPEQARGLPVDARTDVWSLGVVLYELLAGRPPFEGPTTSDVIVAVLDRAPGPLAALAPGVPAELERVVERALAKDRAARHPDVGALRDDLRQAGDTAGREVAPAAEARTSAALPRRARLWTAAAACVLALLATGLVVVEHRRGSTTDTFSGRESATAPNTGAVRLVVLPFENLGRPEDAYFVDGMADEIRGKLAALPGLEVIARSSSIEYRRTTKRPSEIARELDVRYLLTGTVRYEPGTGEAPGRVRVSPELVEVRTTAPVTKWQQAFDAALTGVFVVQADVAGRVAEALDLALGTRERARLAERPTANVAAYDAFLRGEEATQALAAVDPALLRRAIPHYEHAVRLDSGFARAWSRLGESRAFLYINSVEREPELAAAVRAAAERSVTLAPAQPEPRAAMAAYYMFVRDDLGRAAEELTLGLSFAPNHADLLVVAGNLDLARDEPERSLARLRRAAHLDPRSARAAVSLGWTLLWLRQYAEARKESMRAVALIPGDMGALEQLAMVHLAEGDLPGARRVLSSVPPEIDRARLATYFAVAFDLWWVLDDAQQRAVLEAGPQVYEDPVWWRMAAAYIAASHGESARSRAHADSCRIAVEAALERSSNVAELHTLRGLALAYLGRREEAVREGERGVALMPRSKDAIRAAYLQHGLANILIRVGEHDRALETLEPLLSRPYYLSPGWLRIDPTFAPLRGHPRFERLAAGT